MTWKVFAAFIFIAFNCLGQENLIWNGSFEILYDCPEGNSFNSSIESAKGWKNPVDTSLKSYLTPDLFNRCNQGGELSVPKNWYGYQEPSTGNGYVGIFTYQSDNERDFIQFRLNEKLIKGRKYLLKFDLVFGHFGSFKCNNISFALTKDKIEVPSFSAVQAGNYFPSLSDTDVVEFNNLFSADTLNWVNYSKEFFAKSAAQYVTIGNFRNNENSEIKFGWYYDEVVIHSLSAVLLDNISLICLDTLSCDSSTAIIPVNEKEIRVYPNPAKDHIQLKSGESLHKADAVFFDVHGRCVQITGITESNPVISLSGLPAGIYFFAVRNKEGMILHREKLLIGL